jgi:hypothetical protein
MPATIFSGTKVKALKKTLNLNGGVDVISSTVDPTSVATDAAIGSLLLNETSGLLYRKLDAGSSTNWAIVSSGASGINYIKNPDAEANTTGWATYADAAGVAPVDGTGGSPASTFTRNTSSPLLGIGDFLWTKSAANRQGEGFSYDFTIDNAYKSSNLLIQFPYFTSTNYVDGDMRVYVYDVTNAVLIEPSQRDLLGSTNGRYIGTFQTASNSTSYRLIVHQSSTNANAVTANFDAISVGPNARGPSSGIVTPWASFTMTGSWVTNTTYSGQWRRLGDSMEIMGRVATTGAPTSTTLDITIPFSAQIDTTKIPGFSTNDGALGQAQVWSSVNANIRVDAIAVYNSATTFSFVAQGGGATTANTLSRVSQASSHPQTFANGDSVNFRVLIPILGWSAGTEDSGIYDNREVSFAVTQNGVAQTGINPNGSSVKITWATADFDSTGSFDLTNDRFVAPTSGKYQFDATVAIGGTNVLANIYQVILHKTGTQIKGGQYWVADAGGTFSRSISTTLDLVKGDYVEVFLYGAGNNSASTLSTNATTLQTHFSGHKINTVTASGGKDKVIAQYASDAGQTIEGTQEIIDFEDKILDTHNAVTTGASWKFTAPRAGLYLFNAKALYTAATWASGAVSAMDIFVDGGTTTARLSTFEAISGDNTAMLVENQGTKIFNLNKGQTVDIRIEHTSTSKTLISGGGNRFVFIDIASID